MLLRTHGPAVLEQLIGLEAALAAAAENGIRITDADVEAETERSLRNLSNPLSSVTDGDMDRETAERLLDRVLTQRNISREVFRVVMRRNALLRRIVQSQLHVTDQQLRDEYERAYGERVQVRHIQLATPAEAARVQERLANGGNFVELAKLHSANQITAQRGGLLDSFSRREDMLASHFRDVAFALE
ncbi:MAG: peptidylprolyl isomerase, partial [Planctomycetes bacterium]|nr:peptidylprolyl isomerase [Planctomycetota bacterium]